MFVLAKGAPAFVVCGARVAKRAAVTQGSRTSASKLSRPLSSSGAGKGLRRCPSPPDLATTIIAKAEAGSQAFASEGGDAKPHSKNNKQGLWLVFGVVFLLAVAATAVMSSPTTKDILFNGPLGKSGFLAAFSLIFLSEIGDKTFFIAAILAAKLGRWMSFFGSLASLGLMTVISVLIGVVVGRVPDALKSSIPVGEIAGIALLVFFGLRTLRDGLKQEANHGKAEEEQAEAEKTVKEAESSGRVNRRSPLQSFLEVATLVFIAEWGDRSMLATIALGASQNPYGVAVGAVAGHAIATGIAVVGGAIASKYVSERTINITSGVLFLLFAVATAFSLM